MEGEKFSALTKLQEIDLGNGKRLLIVAETMDEALALLWEFAQGWLEHLGREKGKLTDDEREEMYELQREFDLRSMGDRPMSPPAAKLRRLMELEAKATAPCGSH